MRRLREPTREEHEELARAIDAAEEAIVRLHNLAAPFFHCRVLNRFSKVALLGGALDALRLKLDGLWWAWVETWVAEGYCGTAISPYFRRR